MSMTDYLSFITTQNKLTTFLAQMLQPETLVDAGM